MYEISRVDLKKELKCRQDAIRSDTGILIKEGADADRLLRLVRMAYQAGIVADKLNSMEIHDILTAIEQTESA